MAEVQTPAVASAKDTALLIVRRSSRSCAESWRSIGIDELALPLRVAMVIAGLAAAAGLVVVQHGTAASSGSLRMAARIELRKVVWPEREETIKTTYVVFIFAIVMGLFFWGLDWVLTWLTRLLSGQSG